MSRARLLVWVLPLIVPLCLLAFDARPAAAANFTIASPACTATDLISAMTTANGNNQDDTIDLNGCTITLTAVNNTPSNPNGLPVIDDDNSHGLTIQNGTIQRSPAGGTPSFRIVDTGGDTRVTLQHVTISGGNAAGIAQGGGIRSQGGSTLTLNNSTVSGNTASASTDGGSGQALGGGIYSSGGTLTLINSTVSGNTAGASGGLAGGAIAQGGGIYSSGGTLTLINSTVSGNTATASSVNSTAQGGGIFVASGTMKLTHSTVTNNAVSALTTAQGGGIAYLSDSFAFVRASIVALQQNGADCFYTPMRVLTGGYDIESGTSCDFLADADQQNVSSAALQLGPLANNGGPTQTHALLAGSVAIDAVQATCTSAQSSTIITTDQRGVARPQDGDGNGTAFCDSGAYERAPGTLQFSTASYSVGEGGGSVTITVTRTGGTDGAVGATVTLGGGSSTATQGSDYNGTTFPISFAAGDAANKTFNIPIVQDTLDEPDETVLLTLGSPTGGTSVGSTATLTITDDDATPTLAIGNVTVPEGNSGSTTAQFQVTLSAASGRTVTVQAQTANGVGANGAVAGSDYTSVGPITLTFNPGDTTKTVDVPVLGDTVDEADETFTVGLSSPVNATIATATGTATITDDDATVTPCSPRPSPIIGTSRIGTGRLRVTVTVQRTALLPSNTLQRLDFGVAENTRVEVPGAAPGSPGGPGGTPGNFSLTLPPGTQATVFILQRQQPGPFKVSYVVVDGCDGAGPFRTFVGGGVGVQ